jgi:hypothetical protein
MSGATTRINESDRHRPDTSPGAPLRLAFESPLRTRDWIGNGFVGAWSHRRPLAVSAAGAGTARSGPNWFIEVADEPGAGRAIHHCPERGIAVAFEGYTVDPGLHHASPSPSVTAFWSQRRSQRVNGHFAAAIVDERRAKLTLRTDAFGFAPLYYRQLDDVVLFATHADWLIDPATEPDPVALFSVLETGMIGGERSLHAGIQRVPLGGDLAFGDDGGPPRIRRHDLAIARNGGARLTRTRMDAIEESLQAAVERCVALDYGAPYIALSSGLDSRRLLGCMLNCGARPDAFTVRVLQHGQRDLDARFAHEICNHFGLRHTIRDLPEPTEHARDVDIRRRLLGAETPQHHWALALQRAYPEKPATIFKGFLGDKLHEPDERPGDYLDPSADMEAVVRAFMDRTMLPLLHRGMDHREQIGATVREYLEPYRERPHGANLTDLVVRSRRLTAIGGQLRRSLHLEARPFVDLDVMELLLSLDPCEKIDRTLRRRFLDRYHPELARFGGSGHNPAEVSPDRGHADAMRLQAYIRLIARDVPAGRMFRRLRRTLSPKALALVAATRLAPARHARRYWATLPILEAALHPERIQPVWRFGPSHDNR